MISFKDEHVVPILTGRKTQTRRLGRKRWSPGGVHRLHPRNRFQKSFALAEILEVRREMLLDISPEDAIAEGYPDPESFFEAFSRIYGLEREQLEGLTVWVIRFRITEAFEGIRKEVLDTTLEKPRRRLAD